MNVHASLEQLPRFAEQFWATVGDSKVFAFHGPMGAGKTTIIEALCAYKGVKERMGSPTFSIINEYDCRGERIFHIDLYRLRDEQEIIQAGVEDCVYSGDICMVEWPEKAPHLFDEHAVHVYIQPESANERSVTIEMQVHQYRSYYGEYNPIIQNGNRQPFQNIIDMMKDEANEMITKKEGYEAMLYTLKAYWENSGSTDLTDILSGGEYWKGTNEPADSAFWAYWVEAIERVKRDGPMFKVLRPE